jgi:hypothetical protein
VRAITKYQMVDRINDIAWQAHQGSVAAIIQVLNEKLVMSGVRTRAIFANGVLQLLCEAPTVKELEQSTLVPKIQQILESITPRHIRRVNINTRIVREEQLLWLEEINRDTDNQLLWSQEITVSQPNLWRRLIPDLTAYTQSRKPILVQPQSLLKNQNQGKISFKTLLIGLSGLSPVILLAWLLDSSLGNPLKNLLPLAGSQSSQIANQRPPESSNRPRSQSFSIPSDDPFAASVRLANQATVAGKTAITSTQWLELAATWQRASDLMSQVPPSHSRYQEAQIRTKLYKKFSEVAEKEADKTEN